MFLHFGLLHIIFNCAWLLQLGPQIEATYGRSRYLILYLGSGLAGFVVSVGYHWVVGVNAIGGGASGVVFGLMGAALVQGYVKRAPGTEVYRSDLVKWVILGVIISLLPGVDLAAHAGGFVGGGLMGLVMSDRHSPRRFSDRAWKIIESVALVLLVLSFLPLVMGAS
jgi:rhomboid protease GluP